VTTDALIDDLVEKIRLLEDKLIRNDDPLNEDNDVEIVFSESNCGDLNKNDPEEKLADYQLIVCSKCTFKTFHKTESKIHNLFNRQYIVNFVKRQCQ
jgi:DNA-directed RNA polymerase subunit RPC12/RpoP